MMYYSASSTYIRSAIGLAVSKNIEGPYKYVDTVVYSGFTKDEAYDADSKVNKKWTNTNIGRLIEDGDLAGVNTSWFKTDGSYNNALYPNAIDAAPFLTGTGSCGWLTAPGRAASSCWSLIRRQAGRFIPGRTGRRRTAG